MEILLCGFPRFFLWKAMMISQSWMLEAFQSYQRLIFHSHTTKKLPIFCLYHTSALWSFTDFHHLHIFIFPSSRSSQYEWSRTEILRHYFFHKKKIHEINNLKGLFLEEKNSGYLCWRQTKFILSQILKLFIYVITRFVKISGMRAWGKNEEMRLNRTA